MHTAKKNFEILFKKKTLVSIRTRSRLTTTMKLISTKRYISLLCYLLQIEIASF